MPEAIQLRPLGPVHTDVRHVQTALDTLWDEAQIETRAYTGNIIALTTSRHLRRVQDALSGLEGRYAGRQIVGVMDGNELIGVQVSLVPQQGLYVERVILNANPEQLQGAILPLMRPATINHVWWAADDAPGGALLRELKDIADQVIVDSLSLDVPPSTHYSLADLGWSRSAGWREALAQIFDSPDAAAQLRHIRQLKVAYAGDNDLAARLFGGWIAHTLGWKDLGRVEFVAGHCPRENGDLCHVELTGPDVRFSLETEGKEMCRIRAEFSGMDRQTEVVIPRMSLSEGLERVMSHPERAVVFEAAWKLAHASLDVK
ncbi:glucose-6-phosphate dehydrogenase assembly protein OpcA [Deinococcus aquiradiocola]|uniref:Glucose-6-phosphate dehydrogenase n=1 Tax=Deinococcus aquiradiocola TaxID=393059 RepID=A0A917P5N0_9DEIO|nr:glucose-6-phosphate dehydrogenase assembly protein OpcA [Deinococcus aquiradiocola]GGJ62749.1 glucose-6-phosphate dehydrogenase [Deinococcus aquiradiocola]